MGYDGQPPAPKAAPQVSAKTQEVLDFIEHWEQDEHPDDARGLLRALYEPALATAAAINLIRAGNASAAPFVGAAGVVLSQALSPLVDHFGDGETTFEQVMERVGIPVVSFADLPDAPTVEEEPSD